MVAGFSEVTRRALDPPRDSPLKPISFNVQEVLKKVRRANKAAAGGPNGTDYMTLSTWFAEDDATSAVLTDVLSLERGVTCLLLDVDSACSRTTKAVFVPSWWVRCCCW